MHWAGWYLLWCTILAMQSVKVLNDSDSEQFPWSYNALDWMASSSVRPAVVSMRMGDQGIVSSSRGAVKAAVSAGVTVVVAEGNSNSNSSNFSPASVPNAITVSPEPTEAILVLSSCEEAESLGDDAKSVSDDERELEL